MITPQCSALLVRIPSGAGGAAFAAAAATKKIRAGDFQFELEPLFDVPHTATRNVGLAATKGKKSSWYVARPTQKISGAKGWDLAHKAFRQKAGLVGLGPDTGFFIEPDLEQGIETQPEKRKNALAVDQTPDGGFQDQDVDLPGVRGVFAWHLGDSYSQLKSAREAVDGNGPPIRIAHLDTGYDSNHHSLPLRLRTDLQRNFVDDQPPDDATAKTKDRFWENASHGTGTMSILAGKRIQLTAANYTPFDDFLGGAPMAEVIPLRVGRSVVQFKTSTVAAAINYATTLCDDEATRVHVMSMSMGGVSSRAWADAVNLAYEKGILYVAAAGNNLSARILGLPTRFIVYPARFHRVVAACGVMANNAPYYGLKAGTMQGNFGPKSKMETAMSAFTPNISWAKMGFMDIVRMNGEGTSSATPQVAAAAALYLQRHAATLLDPALFPEPWMRVEAIRHALFSSADREARTNDLEKLGHGILRAHDALNIAPVPWQQLQKTPEDRAIFPFLSALTGLGLREVEPSPQQQMLMLEATQLFQQAARDGEVSPFETILPDPDVPAMAVSAAQRRKVFEAIVSHPAASEMLKTYAKKTLATESRSAPKLGKKTKDDSNNRNPNDGNGNGNGTSIATALDEDSPFDGSATQQNRARTIAHPPSRRLRVFSLDPSLSVKLDTAPISSVALSVPWENLEPGPVGEYLEVIDVDPASNCSYYPVDLNDPRLLAQDGYQPSEGTPQFHQQMVYAVASLIIKNFERALGRRTLWRPGPPQGDNPYDDSVFVRRLRIYPHALREPNAYYDPNKIALLFGYFNASEDASGEHLPRGLVFSCLSHDIIAHETAHALLDGINRGLLLPTNPDVRAFHEAFADLVALLQHFTFPEVVRQQIANSQGNLRSQRTSLAELAQQFAQGTGPRKALRSAVGDWKNGVWQPVEPKPGDYDTMIEAHDRGGLLVAAVFDAFLSIYENRTADLIRLASDGSGILRQGAIHPDLVNRLAAEVTKSARHVFTMCVRALDYCPPVDITFGEYLRALITADVDLVDNDDMHYRVAFIQAFQRRGLYPRDVRTLSVESLLWRDAQNDGTGPSEQLVDGLAQLRSFSRFYENLDEWPGDATSASISPGEATADIHIPEREKIFRLERELRRAIHGWLKSHLENSPHGDADAKYLGLDPKLGFEVRTARFANRGSPDGKASPQLILALHQRKKVPGDSADPHSREIEFEGGCTIIGDLRQRGIRYCIRKGVNSETRLRRQTAFATAKHALTSTYFDEHNWSRSISDHSHAH